MARPETARAGIRLWGQKLGAVVEYDGGSVFFAYNDSYQKNGHSISPVHLPLNRDYPVSFPQLDDTAFMGLPGVLADALPDAFGRRAVRQYYERQGEPDKALSPVQQLLYVGKRGIGALEFYPPERNHLRDAEREILELQKLALDAKKIVHDDPDVAIPEIYKIGSSAGGRRPKAIVNYNQDNQQIRSGRLDPKDNEEPVILKFDGADEDRGSNELSEPKHYNRVEHAYNRMAQEAGIEMPDIMSLQVDGYYHLLIPRFDTRKDGTRFHQHTLGGLHHYDYNYPGECSYEQYLETILDLEMDYSALREGFRRMVFNVMAVNQDDHVKNFSFHMDSNGDWSLTPAYDLTFVAGSGHSQQHQMTIQGKQNHFSRADLLAVAEEFGINNPQGIIDDVRDVVDSWSDYARDTRVPDQATRRIEAVIEERQKELNEP